MNLHEGLTPEQSAVHPHHRITPEELTRALASIEARKQQALQVQKAEEEAKQAYLAATIPVEEAVQELNLEASAEEIWAEVQAHRTADLNAKEAQADCAGSKEAILSFDLSPSRSQTASVLAPRLHRKLPWRRIISALLILSVSGIVLSSLHTHSTFRSSAASSPFIYNNTARFNVSDFPNAIPFELTSDGVNRLLHGVDASTVGIDAAEYQAPPGSFGWWHLIKYDDHVYVRGFVPAPPTKEALSGSVVNINNAPWVPENGNRPAEVTLRLDTSKLCSLYDVISSEAFTNPSDVDNENGSKIVATDVHLDEHAWEQAGFAKSAPQPLIPDRLLHPALNTQERAEKQAKTREEAINIAKHLQKPQSTPYVSYPNERSFVIPYGDLNYILSGIPVDCLRVPSNQQNLNNPANMGEWQIIKHQGHLYLRGWVAADTPQSSMGSQFLYLYNSPLPAELSGAAKQISLRLGSFHYGPNGRIYSKEWYMTSKGFEDQNALFQEQIPLTSVHLDAHAWEKW